MNNIKTDTEFRPVNLALSANIRKGQKEEEAALAKLSFLIGELLEELAPEASAESSGKTGAPNDGPSNATMQRALGALMEMLALLQADNAKAHNKIALKNAAIENALMGEEQSQVDKKIAEINKATKQREASEISSAIKNWFIHIAVALGVLLACLGCQPELAALMIASTVASDTGALDKLAKVMADSISKSLQESDPTMSKDYADKVAKILADLIIVAVTIIVTAATCGAAGSFAVKTAVQTGAEEGIELTNVGANAAAEAAAEVSEEMGSSFDKFLNLVKESNPFSKLSKGTNLTIFTGTQALTGTNFWSDMMAAACSSKENGKQSNLTLQSVMSIILNLVSGLVGAGAMGALCTGPQSESMISSFLKKYDFSSVIKTLTTIQAVGAAGQVASQTALGKIQVDLANTMNEQGQTQAYLSILQSLVRENTQQADSNSRAFSSQMKTWGQEIASLGGKLFLSQEALARELQA